MIKQKIEKKNKKTQKSHGQEGKEATMIKQKMQKKNNKKKNGKKNNKKQKKINLLYANADGITGKITSLISAARATDAHIIGLAETKVSKTHPVVEGYEWVNKPRKNRRGGGVALLIREDIFHLIEVVENLEDHDQEIAWIKFKHANNKVFIGIFYGPQEKCSNEEAERQYGQITTQINKLKNEGQVILMGDFNAKLPVKKENIINQEMTRNGKCMQKMLEETSTIPVTLQADIGMWTRSRKRKDSIERSIIDYVIMTEAAKNYFSLIHIDEVGIHKLKGKEETDHNTIIVELEIPSSIETTKTTTTNFKDEAGWEKFNQILMKENEKKKHLKTTMTMKKQLTKPSRNHLKP